MSPTSYSRALPSLTRLLALLKNISKVPKRQVAKTDRWSISVKSHSSFSQASTIMGEAIRKVPTRTDMIDPRAVPFGHSAFKELELVQQ